MLTSLSADLADVSRPALASRRAPAQNWRLFADSEQGRDPSAARYAWPAGISAASIGLLAAGPAAVLTERNDCQQPRRATECLAAGAAGPAGRCMPPADRSGAALSLATAVTRR
jgi:hypothetical protein